MDPQYTDLIVGNPIRNTGIEGPGLTLAHLWQIDQPTIGQQCGYIWRVEVNADTDYPTFKHLRVRVATNPNHVIMMRTLPSNQKTPDGQLQIGANTGAFFPGLSASYTKQLYKTDQVSNIVDNEAKWTLGGKPDKRLRVTIDGAFFLLIQNTIPANQSIELRFTASARFSGKGLFFTKKPTSEPTILETTVAEVRPMPRTPDQALPDHRFPVGLGYY